MKKRSFVVLLCATLAVMLLLSSCATTGSTTLKKILDGSQYSDADSVYTKAEIIPELDKAVTSKSCNELVLFSKSVIVDWASCEKLTVYNIDSGKVVYEATSSPTSSYDVDLYDLNGDTCFTVVHSEWSLDESNVKIGRDTIDTALYGADGVKIADTYRRVDAEIAHDLIRFDGKCYRIGENAALEYAFDYSDLNSIPEVLYATEKLYFCEAANGIAVYNGSLETEAFLSIPSYANIGAWVELSDNKILIQYSIEVDSHAEKYDYITKTADTGALAKYDLYTVVFNGKNGKSDEIKFNYVISNTLNRHRIGEKWAKSYGLGDKYDNIVTLAPIEDKHINDADSALILAALDSDGSIKQIKNVTDAPAYAEVYTMRAVDRWLVRSTDNKEFIVNEKGKVIGETSAANYRTKYMYADGKMYDYDLNVIYDYAKDNLEIDQALDQAVLLRNVDDELICYTASGDTVKLIEKGAKRTLYLAEHNYFVIKECSADDKVKFEIYNGAGTLVTTVNPTSALWSIDVSEAFSVIATHDGRMILRVAVDTVTTGNAYKYEFYRFS